MKTLVLCLLLLVALTAKAAPYLTCNPYPANADTGLNIVSFVITFTAPSGLSPVTISATIGTSGSQNLYYDLAPLTNASYTVTAAAINGFAQESPQSVPFTFQKGVPSAPTGLTITPSIPSPVP